MRRTLSSIATGAARAAPGLFAAFGGSKPAQLPVETPTAMKPDPMKPPVETPPAPPPGPAKDYPATRRDDVVDTIHDVAVHDPYRWLEDEAKPEVQAWMKAQDQYARSRLAALPHRDEIAARLKEVFYYDAVGAPEHRHGRYFFAHKLKDQEKTIVYWKQGEKGKDQVLLDPNTWSKDGSAGLHGWWPSWDGKVVAYNLSEHNADEATMKFLDVATGKLLPDTIPGTKYGYAAWTPDSRGFYYTWVPEPSDKVPVADRPGFAELRYHRMGTDPAKDPVVHPATHDAKTFLAGGISKDGHWLFTQIQHGWNSSDWYVKDLRHHQKDWTTLIAGVPSNFDVSVWKDHFYVLTNDGAPRYRVFKVDPRHLAREAWKEIVPEQKDATLEGMNIVGGHLVLNYLRNAVSEMEIHDLNGKLVRKVELPGLGTASYMHGQPDEDTGYFAFSSYTEPQIIFKTSIRTGKVAEWARVKLPIDTSKMTTEQVHYTSKDGTEITMFLIHRTDLKKDGKTPTILNGYGGFNVSETPGFSAARAVWIERGGIWAIPNLRGGGEYGEDWHKAGMLLKKQNVFDDFIAAGKYLVDQGWTDHDHLAIYGGSNGGLLMGAAITQAPEQWKAVICAVPLLDMIRYQLFGSGATWIPEYGSADDPEQFKALYAYSPYHHVVQGMKYPAVLVSTSDHDDRVDPMHARKFAAELQWATGSDAPVWLRIEKNGSHHGADMVKAQVEQYADFYAFLMWQLGM